MGLAYVAKKLILGGGTIVGPSITAHHLIPMKSSREGATLILPYRQYVGLLFQCVYPGMLLMISKNNNTLNLGGAIPEPDQI